MPRVLPQWNRTRPRTHEENRKVLCAICVRKKGVRLLTVGQENTIQQVDSCFSLQSCQLPSGICNGCRVALMVRI